jgi:hypothetical protein
LRVRFPRQAARRTGGVAAIAVYCKSAAARAIARGCSTRLLRRKIFIRDAAVAPLHA